MQMPDNREKKLLSYVGFAARSRGVAIGTEQTLNAVRKSSGKVVAVVSADASERTKKQLRDKCTFYETMLLEVGITSEELGKTVGKRAVVSAVAVTDSNLAKAIKALYKDSAENI